MKPPPPNPDKPLLSLSIGDPTTDGNLLPPPEAVEALVKAVQGQRSNGYFKSFGHVEARRAVAKYWVSQFIKATPENASLITEETTAMSSGGSHALLMTMQALANPGDNIILPSPFFPLYGTICANAEIEDRYYPLLPEREWEADMERMEAAIDERTRAILINSPSNPCGSVFSRKHLTDLLALAERRGVPVVSDEVYAGLVFEGSEFVSVADVACGVPRFVISALSKIAVVPGWRMGWVILVDPKKTAGDVWGGIVDLTTLQCGPNSIVQAAIPPIMDALPLYVKSLATQLTGLAEMTYNTLLRTCPGLRPTRPRGAMYVMVGIDTEILNFADDVEFAAALQTEAYVVVLPGTIFRIPGFFRMVATRPREILEESCRRIAEFCRAHRRVTSE